MLGWAWNLLKRHRRKIFFTGIFIGGGYVIGKYVRQKLIEFHEREAEEFIKNARKQHHFESNQRTCCLTVFSLLPTLKNTLCKRLNSESLTTSLKNKPENKIEIWEQLKIMSFTRSIVAVYLSAVMIALLKIQLNILGGYIYTDSMNQQSGEHSSPVVSTDVQAKYLDLCRCMLSEGLQEFLKVVGPAVHAVLGEVSLKQKLTPQNVEEFLGEIRRRIEDTGNGHSKSAALVSRLVTRPGSEQACALSSEEIMLNRLHEETQDITESRDFDTVLMNTLDSGFCLLMYKITDFFRSEDCSQQRLEQSGVELSVPMAKLIPVVNGMVNVVCMDQPNPFINELLQKPELHSFSANIYESFSSTNSRA